MTRRGACIINRSSLRRVYVVALRVVRQLKRDRRTIGLITFAPIFLMVLFGYALSGEMSGVRLGLVDFGGEEGLRAYLESVQDFDIMHLGSESDAEKQIVEGRLHGAVILQQEGVTVLEDASSPQIASSIMAKVMEGLQGREIARKGVRVGSNADAAMVQRGKPGKTVVQRYIYGYDLQTMDSVGPAVLGLVVFFFTFIMAAISFLRERTQGTLEKFMVSPLSRPEIVSGYLVGFSLFSFIQSATTLIVVVFLFGVPMTGNPLTAFAVILLLGAGATALGAFFSNFARSEFQVVQFIPIVILPQVVLTGVWWPLQSIPDFIRPVSYLLPLTYSSEALRLVMLKDASFADVLPDIAALGAFFAMVFVAATLMLKREIG